MWVHSDHDLVYLTITTTTHAPHSTVGKKSSEVVHTTEDHPFYTLEHGFVPVHDLKPGMHVLQADGQVGVITGWKVVPGAQVMYNLEVAQDPTFTVGTGQWIVHNKCNPGERQQLRNNLYRAGQIPDSVDTQAHHIVPCDFKQDLLVAQAINGGFNFNSTNNGIALPTNLAGATLLDPPFHRGSHPTYNRCIQQQLEEAKADLEAQYGSLNNVPDWVAYDAVQSIANNTRYVIENAGGSCSIDEI